MVSTTHHPRREFDNLQRETNQLDQMVVVVGFKLVKEESSKFVFCPTVYIEYVTIKKSGWRDRAVKVHSIVSTVATSPIVRSHSRAAYHDLLSMILQILLPGVALYKVEGRISKSDNRLQSPRSERAAIAPPTENFEYRREHHSQAKY